MSASGQERRFERLALPHLSRLVVFARRFSAPDAEDYVQEAFARAFRAFDQIEDEGAVRSWLYRIVATVASEDQRTRARRRELLDVSQLEARHEDLVASGDAGPLEVLLAALSSQRLREALDSLPEEFSQAVELHDLHELKYREIAEVTGAPIGTVMSRISRGRRLLAGLILSHGDEWELPRSKASPEEDNR
ncbi:MAG: RNA polymerase sigma factor SigR [Myxococcales bacterium]